MVVSPDPLLVGRYAVLIAMCELIPIPIVDGMVENRLRRALVRAQAARHELALDEEQVRLLADRPSGGCRGMVLGVLWWPIKKLLKTLTTIFMVKGIVDVASEVVHRALMFDEAATQGWLPSQVDRVRASMDTALTHVDTRLIERRLMGKLREPKGRFNQAVWETAQAARRGEVVATANEGDAGPGLTGLSEAVMGAASTPGLVPEVLHWFKLAFDDGSVE